MDVPGQYKHRRSYTMVGKENCINMHISSYHTHLGIWISGELFFAISGKVGHRHQYDQLKRSEPKVIHLHKYPWATEAGEGTLVPAPIPSTHPGAL